MGQATSSPDHVPNRWQEVRQLADDTPTIAIPATPRRPAGARLDVGGVVYDQVPETGFTMLAAWLAGPQNLVRLLDVEQRTVTVTVIRGSTRSTYTEPRTQADRDITDESIEEYLADAGVPAPPRGYRWYQRPPGTYDNIEDVYRNINAALRAADPSGTTIIHPRDIAPVMASVVTSVYSS